MNKASHLPYVIIGGGPAGLMAAEILGQAGKNVVLYDRMPSAARKFLMAGRGGLNLTHSEALDVFLSRYGRAREKLEPAIRAFPPEALRAWCEGLGQPTFVGSSGRVFPRAMKASPLLRAWLQRLENFKVKFRPRHDWKGWDSENRLLFQTPDGGIERVKAAATLLALGGASWPRLGADGNWVNLLAEKNIPVTPLRPANCGFSINWSDHFRTRFEGQPLKSVGFTFEHQTLQGEAMITAHGIEGGAIYALSASLRDAIAAQGTATLMLDLRPGLDHAELVRRLKLPRGALSFSTHLKRNAGLSPLAIGLLQEIRHAENRSFTRPEDTATIIKALPVRLTGTHGMARAISTAGGIAWEALDAHFMLRGMPGVFAAGEMLDWEAPTGGYLLQATFSTAIEAARGMLDYTG